MPTGITITHKYKRIVFANFHEIVLHSRVLARCPAADALRDRVLGMRTRAQGSLPGSFSRDYGESGATPPPHLCLSQLVTPQRTEGGEAARGGGWEERAGFPAPVCGAVAVISLPLVGLLLWTRALCEASHLVLAVCQDPRIPSKDWGAAGTRSLATLTVT